MKEIIIKVLDKLFHELINNYPNYSRKVNEIQIPEDLTIKELNQFIIDNEIPDNAQFNSNYEDENIFIYWKVDIKLSEKEKIQHISYSFNYKGKNLILKALINDGYKFKYSNNYTLKCMENDIYKLYLKKDFKSIENIFKEELIKE